MLVENGRSLGGGGGGEYGELGRDYYYNNHHHVLGSPFAILCTPPDSTRISEIDCVESAVRCLDGDLTLSSRLGMLRVLGSYHPSWSILRLVQ